MAVLYMPFINFCPFEVRCKSCIILILQVWNCVGRIILDSCPKDTVFLYTPTHHLNSDECKVSVLIAHSMLCNINRIYRLLHMLHIAFLQCSIHWLIFTIILCLRNYLIMHKKVTLLVYQLSH